MTATNLLKNWQNVRDQIREVEQSISANDAKDNKKNEVTLLAVSKTKPAQMVAELARAGQVHFGENYLQEAQDKINEVNDLMAGDSDQAASKQLVWHYIGHIQRNKTRDIASAFDWVHTIERDIIAKRLNNQRPDDKDNLNVLIQVNIDKEESKSGCMPEALNELVKTVKTYDRLNLRGLMIIPSTEDTGAFERTKILFDDIRQSHPELTMWDTLSMGMSSDLQQAITQGSTMVRVGSAIFGERE